MGWIAAVLGVFDPQSDFLDREHARGLKALPLSPGDIEAKLAARLAARAAKDWAQADAIRDELGALGIKIKDRPDGTTEWSVSVS